MNQTINCDVFLFAGDSWLFYRHKDIKKERERTLNKKFGDWFEDNKLGIHLREDKIKCIVFDTKHRPKNAQNVKQWHILVAH